MHKEWRIAPENDDFLLKHCRIFCNSRYNNILSRRPADGGTLGEGDRVQIGRAILYIG